MKTVSMVLFSLVALFANAQDIDSTIVYYRNGMIAEIYVSKAREGYAIRYYENGNKKDSVTFIRELITEILDSVPYLKDSLLLSKMDSIGYPKRIPYLNDSMYSYKSDTISYMKGRPIVMVKYFENGCMQFRFRYTDLEHYFSFEQYRKNGTLLRTGAIKNGKNFGMFHRYNRKEKLMARADFNHGKPVLLNPLYTRRKYRNELPFSYRMHERKKVILSNNGQHKRHLKVNAMAYLKFSNRDTCYKHCLVNGFIGDSVVLSKFSYGSKEQRYLKFDSVFIRHLSDIKEVVFLDDNDDGPGGLATGLVVGGLVMVIDPLILFPALSNGETYNLPITWIFASSGVIALYTGLKLQGRLSRFSFNTIQYNPGK